MTKAHQLEHAVQDAFNTFMQDNHGRAARMIELPPDDWKLLRDHIKAAREAEGFEISTADVAKTDGRENFRLYGVPIVAGVAGLKEVRAIAPKDSAP